MILGIGVDIVHLPRIAAVLKRQYGHKFARRILSSAELGQWHNLQGSEVQQLVRFLAVRWAVKEAAYKALYPTIRPTWQELNYQGLTQTGEKPILTYTPLADGLGSKVGPIHTSVSHDGEYAVAYVTVEWKMAK